MNNVYYVGSGELTFDLIERIINENLKLELAPEAKLRIQKCRDYLDKKIAESEEPLYGITTGFGSLCSKSISSDELGTLQENLIFVSFRRKIRTFSLRKSQFVRRNRKYCPTITRMK